MDLEEIRWEFVERLHLTQDRDQKRAVVDIIMKLWSQKNATNITS